jgi:hypothetical protein
MVPGQVFSEYFGFPCQSSFHQLLHNHPHLSSGAGTIGQKWLQYKGLAIKKESLPVSDQILVELIQAGGETLRSKIHKLINPIWNKEKLPDQWKEFTRRVIKLIVVIIMGYHCYRLHTKFFLRMKSVWR